MKEYFYVVDDNDEVIGKEERSICHKKNLIHRAIAIFIFNDKGELLLQKRSQEKDLYQEYWACSVGGHVDFGEEYRETAIRELKEELGIKIPLKQISLIKVRGKTDLENDMFFIGKNNGPFNFNREEIDKVDFFSIDKIKEMIKKEKFTSHFLKIFQFYLTQL